MIGLTDFAKKLSRIDDIEDVRNIADNMRKDIKKSNPNLSEDEVCSSVVSNINHATLTYGFPEYAGNIVREFVEGFKRR